MAAEHSCAKAIGNGHRQQAGSDAQKAQGETTVTSSRAEGAEGQKIQRRMAVMSQPVEDDLRAGVVGGPD
jgi:hypothetical protein